MRPNPLQTALACLAFGPPAIPEVFYLLSRTGTDNVFT
jgi:hypothetical protein